MQQNVSQFGFHQFIRVLTGIQLCVDTSPRRTYDKSISLERLHLQEILVQNSESIKWFAINSHVIFEHAYLAGTDIVDNVLLEMIAQMNRDTTDSAKRLENLLDACLFETLQKMH